MRAVEKLPAKIRVGPFDFRIEKWTNLQAQGAHRWGEFSSCELRISIQADMPSTMKAADTLLHEVGHAIWWAYGLEDDDKQERIINGMATAWVQVYRDNLWLRKWLGECVDG